MERIEIDRPVERVSYIAQACKGKFVLDLGALDETAFTRKRGGGSWLHEELANNAARVVGIDQSDMLTEDGFATNSNALIVRGDIFDINKVIKKTGICPDMVVAGELIEHLDNPLTFLHMIRTNANLKGATLVLSTPNATAVHNVLIGFMRRESMHPDHLCIFSFKTLNTLLARAGFKTWRITPYYSCFVEMKQKNKGVRRGIVAAGEKFINLVEHAFPLLSFGFIAEVIID